jgi:hypothetical protein
MPGRRIRAEMVLEYNPANCKEKIVAAQIMKINALKGYIEKN